MTVTKTGRIYGRFSSNAQERGDSKRRQIDGAKAYAAKNGIDIIDEPYFDEGVSGKAGANLEKEFGRLLGSSKEGDVILCEALDRIGRQNPLVLGGILYNAVQRGITIIAWQEGKVITRENIDNLDTQFSVFTGSAVSHADNKRKMDRLHETAKAAYALAEKGIQTGTLVKYLPQCFEWNAANKSIDIEPNTASTVRRIFDMYVSGAGRTVIAQTLNKEKIPTLYGKAQRVIGKCKPWMETSIAKILKNESYAGVLRIKGVEYTCIPTVVNRAIFDKAQHLMSKNTRRHGKLNGRINNLFAGIAICKHCGGTVNVNVTMATHNRKKASYFYRCKNARLKICPEEHKMLNARTVELSFFGHYFGGSPETTFASGNTNNQARISDVSFRIAKIKKAIEALYDMAEEGDSEAKERIRKRRNELAKEEATLKELQNAVYADELIPTMLQEIEEVMDYADTQDAVKTTELLKSFYPRLENKLSKNENRKKLVQILPTLFSKVEIDCIHRTVQAFPRHGNPLDLLSLDTFEDVE
jgi:DNA invertase Pin-like site-specific DNA recombinase